jgi:hypothetical protein
MDDLYELAREVYVHVMAAEISKQGYVPAAGAEAERIADRAIEYAQAFLRRWEQRPK